MVIPVLVLLTMLSVQFVLVWHGRNVAEAAARDGLRAAAGYQATGAQGAADCTRYLTTVAGGMLIAPHCSADRNAADVVVTVDATVSSVVPFGAFHVHETAHGPVEVFAAGS